MIVKMKKVSVITLSAEVQDTLSSLRDVGVAHLEYRDAKSPDLQQLVEKRQEAERAASTISLETDARKGGGKRGGQHRSGASRLATQR